MRDPNSMQDDISKLRKALDLMLQAFDPNHPAACHQDCFDSSDGHGYEMQDIAKSRAWEVLQKTEHVGELNNALDGSRRYEPYKEG